MEDWFDYDAEEEFGCDDFDEDELDFDIDDWDLEVGYDPYMGCYSDDC